MTQMLFFQPVIQSEKLLIGRVENLVRDDGPQEKSCGSDRNISKHVTATMLIRRARPSWRLCRYRSCFYIKLYDM